MTSYTALSKRAHATFSYRSRDGWHFAASEGYVPVLQSELPMLVPHYAMAFVPAGEQGGEYQLVALTSLSTKNLYVGPDGKWLGSYVPAALRGYPFRLLRHNGGQQVLCIAPDHLVEDQSKPLFDKDGELSESVARIFNFLTQCEVDRQHTAASVAALASAGLIEEWPLELPREGSDEPLVIQGLYRINEQRLHGLEAQQLQGLQGSPLAVAYAQMFSSHQIREMIRRAEYLAKLSPSKENFDLEAFFGEENDDLTFN